MEKDKLREIKLFRETPVPKALMKMAVPGIIMMLVFGMYTFADNILSINFAHDNYNEYARGMMDSKSLVRIFMAGLTPVTTFMFAISMLFGLGLATRFSINIGAKREERALSTLKTTMQVGIGIGILLIPVLLFTAKPWVSSQYSSDPVMASLIADKAFDYLWIIIISMPMVMFNQMCSSVFRSEGKNRIVLIANIFPIFLNILFDWILMGPCGMGIEGGAWATFISYTLTTLVFLIAIIKKVSSRIILKNMFGRKGFHWVVLIGVCLVGIAPFLRNMAQSITQTVEMSVIQDVSIDVYGNPMFSQQIMSGVFPTFGLFFPLLFAFIQAGTPLASYNYGAKDMKRVRSTILYTGLFSFILGLLIFSLATFVLIGPLNDLLSIQDSHLVLNDAQVATFGSKITDYKLNEIQVIATGTGDHMHIFDYMVPIRAKAQKMLGIMMISMPLFGLVISAMTLFNSTDRVISSIFASTLRGVLLLFPFLYLFKAINHGAVQPNEMLDHLIYDNSIFSNEYTFWWFYPTLGVATTIILGICLFLTLRRLDRDHLTLDERIENINQWIKNRRKTRKNNIKKA